MHDGTPAPPPSRLSRVWQRVIAPSPKLEAPDERRQAQLLSIILLFLIAVGIVGLITGHFAYDNSYPQQKIDAIMLGGVLALVPLYVLSRTPRTQLAAILLVILSSVAIWLMASPLGGDANLTPFVYLALPVLLSSMFLPVRMTVLSTAINLGAMVIIQVLSPDVTYADNWIEYIIALSILIILATRHRALVEQDRWAELNASKDRYRRLVELSPTALVVHREGKVLYANAAGVRLMGGTRLTDVLGRSIWDFIDPKDHNTIRARLASIEYEPDGLLPLIEVRMRRLDGSPFEGALTTTAMTYLGQPALQTVGYDITKRRQAEQALHRSEEQNRALLDAIPDLMFQIRRDGTFVGAKSSAMGTLVPTEAFLGRTIYEVLPELADDAMHYVRRALDTGEVQVFSYQLPVDDGMGDFEARIVASPPDEAVIIVRDITERTRAEAAVMASETAYRTLVQNIPIGIYRTTPGPEGAFLMANPAFLRMFGYDSEADLEGVCAADFYQNPADRLGFSQRVTSEEQIAAVEMRLKRRDGSFMWGAVTARVVRDERGEVAWFDCALEDITERMTAQEALARTEEQMRSFLENLDDLAYFRGLDGTLRLMNSVGARITGHTPDALEDPDVWRAIMHPEDHDALERLFRRHPGGADALEHEYRLRDRHGGWRWFHSRMVGIKDTGGRFVGYTCIDRDITDPRHAQEALRQSEARNQAVLSAIPDLIFRTNAAGFLLDVMPGEGFELDIVPSDWVGRSIKELFPPELSLQALLYIGQVLHTGQMMTFEFQRRVEGDTRDYEARTVISGPDEALTMVRDVTERNRAAQALRDSEARNKAILSAIPDLMFRMSADGRFLDYVAGDGVDLFVPPEDFIGRRMDEIFSPEEAAETLRYVGDALRTGEVQTREYSLDIKGVKRDYESRAAVCGPDEVLIMVRDVTERNRAARALRESEAKNRAILTALPDLMFRINRDGVYLDVHNAGRDDLLAAPVDVMLGRRMREFLPPAVAALILEQIHIALDTGEMRIFTYQLEVPHGQRDFEARLVVSGPDETLLIVRDITERQQAEIALRRRDDILEALVYASEQLLKPGPLDTALPDVLAHLGRAVQASRVYIFENHVDTTGELLASQRYEWVAPGFSAEIDNPDMQNMSYRGVGLYRFQTLLSQGRPVFGRVRDFPAIEQPLFEAQDIQSVLVVPITIADEWWGFVGFDDCAQERQWMPVEVETLRSVATTLAAALARQRSEAAERAQRILAEALSKTAAVINSTLQPEEVLNHVLTCIKDVVPHDATNIMLIENGIARVAGSYGYREHGGRDDISQATFPVEELSNVSRVLETKEPAIVVDTWTDATWTFVDEAPWIRAMISTPIIIDGEVIGALNVDSMAPHVYTAEHAGILGAFTDQVALALRNAQLFAAEQEQRALSDALSDMAATINSTLDPDEVFERILTNVRRVVPHDFASIRMIRDGLRYSVGYRDYTENGASEWLVNLEVPIAETPDLVQAMQTGQPVIVSDTHADPNWKIYPDSAWIRSHAVMPIVSEGGVIGFLELESATPGFFTERHAGRLQVFADHAATAIRNARLFAAEQEQRAMSEALRDTATVINSTLDQDEVLDRILANLGRVVLHDVSSIALLEGSIMRIVRCRGYDRYGLEEAVLAMRLPVADYANLRHMVDTGQPYISPDIQNDPDWTPHEDAAVMRSFASAPIRQDGEVLGFISVQSTQPHFYTATHGEQLQIFADQALIAIRNALLFTAEREQHALSEALRDIAALVNSTLDPDEVFKRILLGIGRVVPHDAANILLIEGDTARVAGSRGYEAHDTAQWMRALVVSLEERPLIRKLIAGGAASAIFDTHVASDWVPHPQTRWIRSHVNAPIRVEGHTLGVINLDAATPGQFDATDAERLQAFADQAAIAIRNAQLFAAEQEQRALSEALRDTVAVINSTLDPDEVFERILATIGEVVPHDAANIMLIEGEQAFVAGSRGYAERGLGDWLHELHQEEEYRRLLHRFAQTDAVAMVSDTRTDPEWVQFPESQWIRSHLSAPIRVDDEAIGVINLNSERPGAFEPVDAERLQIFANQVAIAIKNARLYNELSRHTHELAMLYSGTTFMLSSLPQSDDLTPLGNQVAEAVVKEFSKVDCGVLLVDAKRGVFQRLGRAGNYVVCTIDQLPLDGPGLISAAVRTAKLIYAPDVTRDMRYVEGDPRTRSEMVVPLISSRGVIGALDLQSPVKNAFTERDQRILTVFAERVAAAIENRELYAEIRLYAEKLEQRVAERTVDLSVRNAVAETLSRSLDVNEMLGGVLETTAAQLGVLGGAIHLLDPEGGSLRLVAHNGLSTDALAALAAIIPEDTEPDALQEMSGPLSRALNGDVAEAGIATVLSVPIWRQEQVQGMITLVHDEPRPWQEDETRLLDVIGRQLGVALSNVQLYEDAVRGEAHVRTILQSVGDGLLVFDQDDNLTLINPAAEELLAFYPDERGGPQRAAALLWHWLRERHTVLDEPESSELQLPTEPLVAMAGGTAGVDAQCSAQGCAYAERGDPAWPCWLDPHGAPKEHLNQCPVYTRVPHVAVQAHVSEVRNANGELIGHVCALHDVTYYRELDELKGRFVSTVSHELRTPLSTVLLQVSMLAGYYERLAEHERRDMIEEIQQQAQVLRELVEDILELSRFDAKRAQPQKTWFNMHAYCREVLQSQRATIQKKRLRLDTSDCTDPTYVYGDQQQLVRVLRNLIGNAIKYTPDGGTIRVAMERQGNSVRLTVADTGIGISPDEQLYIFDRFFRSEEAARIASGTGLGLAITKEIVDLHGGRIELQSAVGEGSTFTVTIPTTGRPPDDEA